MFYELLELATRRGSPEPDIASGYKVFYLPYPSFDQSPFCPLW